MTKIGTKMELSIKATKKIKESTALRLKIALELGIGEDAVKRALKRKSKSLLNHSAIRVIKAETGLTEEEILVDKKAVA